MTRKTIMNKPNFYILGAAKAGTTTLYDLLKQHPEVFLSFDKEPMFFSRDDYYSRGLDWYLKTFYSHSEDFPVRGEASPHYLYWAEKVASRIYYAHEKTPVKFIVVLRNPVDRAYSWYWNMIADGREELSFIDALKAEEERLDANNEELEYFGSMRYGYLRGGGYVSQIQSFLNFFSEEQFLFLLQDDLKNDFDEVIQKTCRFLGVSSSFEVKPRKSNLAGLPRSRNVQKLIRNTSALKDFFKPFIPNTLRHQIKTFLLGVNKKKKQYPNMNEEARNFLKLYYQKDIISLSDILARDLSDWRN